MTAQYPAPRPMDTAPRDGTRILLWLPKQERWTIGYWDEDRYTSRPKPFWNHSPRRTSDSRASVPAAWMLLPPSVIISPPDFGAHL